MPQASAPSTSSAASSPTCRKAASGTAIACDAAVKMPAWGLATPTSWALAQAVNQGASPTQSSRALPLETATKG
ncbi:hypothetical protein D3C72_1941680 [compost metagenome]